MIHWIFLAKNMYKRKTDKKEKKIPQIYGNPEGSGCKVIYD